MDRAKRIALRGWRHALNIATFGFFPYQMEIPIVNLTTEARDFSLTTDARDLSLTAADRVFALTTDSRGLSLTTAARSFSLTYSRD